MVLKREDLVVVAEATQNVFRIHNLQFTFEMPQPRPTRQIRKTLKREKRHNLSTLMKKQTKRLTIYSNTHS